MDFKCLKGNEKDFYDCKYNTSNFFCSKTSCIKLYCGTETREVIPGDLRSSNDCVEVYMNN